ncbi:uncharacterized protein ColSpa_05043 [Colletotrichum spaethianum]|uniref:Uncharacterized protein n=1 Tax=Colletotrichum spaethianum TaxID=700344 RepID=A0AA37LIW3_9PEZI|nr:uncharacterized protein ColSpa_05043 [Colletotrichum spaethianum]GKT44862.1 hypothetical protein ColSpa_05043 [Colletotrichum spaethianum]
MKYLRQTHQQGHQAIQLQLPVSAMTATVTDGRVAFVASDNRWAKLAKRYQEMTLIELASHIGARALYIRDKGIITAHQATESQLEEYTEVSEEWLKELGMTEDQFKQLEDIDAGPVNKPIDHNEVTSDSEK